MRTSRVILYAAVAVALAVALIAGVGLRDRTEVAAPSSSPSPTASVAPTTAAPTTATPSPAATVPRSPTTAAAPGAITGRFAYGSDFIPPVTVYAISTTDPRVWSSVDYRGVGNPPRPTPGPGGTGFTYTITGVAPGTYWVVAYRNDEPAGQGPDPGYYSPQAECWRRTPSGPCPDVRLIPVTVTAGQTSTGVDILTWGPPPPEQASPTFPPRPR